MKPHENLPQAEDLCQRLGLLHARGPLARKIAQAIPLSTNLPPEQLPLERVCFWVVDVETTGMGPPRDRVIEVAAVEIYDQSPGRAFATLVNPGLELPEFITRLTGITPAMLATAPPPEAVFPCLQRLFSDAALVAHSSAFDLKFLRHEWQTALGQPLLLPCFCTVRLARRILPELKEHNLDALARRFRLRFGPAGQARGRHRALGDALVTAAVFLKFLRRLRSAGLATLADLRRFQNLPLANVNLGPGPKT